MKLQKSSARAHPKELATCTEKTLQTEADRDVVGVLLLPDGYHMHARTQL
jgi:hypothetical protein